MTNGIPHRGIPFFVADDVRYNFSVYDVVRKGMPTSMRQGFDNEKYIELQAANIRKRIAQFGGKLYLEFGGKLFDDYHASRVLPGFEPDTKFRMLESLVDDVEIVIAINANHIEKGKTRGDLGIPYDEDVLRLIDVFRSRGFLVGSVVLTQYANQPAARRYRHRLEQLGVTCRLHYPIAGYPHDIERIVSDDGYGRMQAGIRSTLRHGDGGAHIHARVNGVEWGIGSQRVATNVAEHLISGIFFFQYLGQHRVHVAMAATLAQSGRAHLYQRRNAEFSLVLLAYGTCHAVRVQLSVL